MLADFSCQNRTNPNKENNVAEVKFTSNANMCCRQNRVMSGKRNSSESCRFCKCCFETSHKLGSKATVLFKPSNRKECRGIILAELCQEVGIELPKDPMAFSKCVCNLCGRKIPHPHHLYEFMRGSINIISSITKAVKKVGSALLRHQKESAPLGENRS